MLFVKEKPEWRIGEPNEGNDRNAENQGGNMGSQDENDGNTGNKLGGILCLFCLYLKFTIQELNSCARFQKENILIYIYLSVGDLFCCK